MACRYSNTKSSVDAVRILLKNGADHSIYDKFGFTPLLCAAKHSNEDSNLETIQLLLDPLTSLRGGVDINYQNVYYKTRITALGISAQYSKTMSSLETVQFLITAGAKLDLPNFSIINYMMTLFENTFDPEVIMLLLMNGASTYDMKLPDLNRLIVIQNTLLYKNHKNTLNQIDTIKDTVLHKNALPTDKP